MTRSLSRLVGTESSFPIELAGVYSTVELDAARFQLSSTPLDPIPEAFNVKRSIPVYWARVEYCGIDLRRCIPLYSGPSRTSDSGPQPSPDYAELIVLTIPGLFRVYSASIP